ncbi:FYN-binding protein 1 [Nematostella vectensis]|uniref:FYN-binding protein 1 n=1 Tax=Nematostella vectensis TaxID=45351 RepID=UPI00207775A4|nr:FYN-binding protein 1 [Nematostella vectensis]
MALSPDDLKSKLGSLKRAPVPKLPIAAKAVHGCALPIEGSNFVFPKLKKTGKRESLIESDIPPQSSQNGEGDDELKAAFIRRRAHFENESKPALAPKPKPKPELVKRLSQEKKEIEEKDTNGNLLAGKPKLRPLPTLQSIGKPPRKPQKTASLKEVLEKFSNHNVIIAPKPMPIETDVNGNDFQQEDYDDINSGVDMLHKSSEVEPIQEEMYDDVDQVADQVKAELGIQENQESSEPISEDFYDDLETFTSTLPAANGLGASAGDEDFGDDVYQPVDSIAGAGGEEVFGEDEYEILPSEAAAPPLPDTRPGASPTQSEVDAEESKKREKKDKEKEKRERELQRKKERDEQKRKKEEEKREREEKKRKEEERKRREKADKELKKIHKLKGNEPYIISKAKEDFKGAGKHEFPCSKGNILYRITQEGCPNNKWLIKSPEGHYGYVPEDVIALDNQASAIEEMSDGADEDLYEVVETFQGSELSSSANNPPPATSGSEDEEFYDDVG